MAERRDRESLRSGRSSAPGTTPGAGRRDVGEPDDDVLDLQRSAGNRAVGELLGGVGGVESAGPALRIRDRIRAARGAGGPELRIGVQRATKGAGVGPAAPTGRLLRRGARGADVAALQSMLGVAADGVFGGDTRAAVIAFQQASGLAPDGIVGPQTMAALAGGASVKSGGSLGALGGGSILGGGTAKSGSTDKAGGDIESWSTEKSGGGTSGGGVEKVGGLEEDGKL